MDDRLLSTSWVDTWRIVRDGRVRSDASTQRESFGLAHGNDISCGEDYLWHTVNGVVGVAWFVEFYRFERITTRGNGLAASKRAVVPVVFLLEREIHSIQAKLDLFGDMRSDVELRVVGVDVKRLIDEVLKVGYKVLSIPAFARGGTVSQEYSALHSWRSLAMSIFGRRWPEEHAASEGKGKTVERLASPTFPGGVTVFVLCYVVVETKAGCRIRPETRREASLRQKGAAALQNVLVGTFNFGVGFVHPWL